MGCASSKALEHDEDALPRGISMPAHQQDRTDNFHIVALTSSTYGILKLDQPNPSEEDSKDGDPVKEMLRRLSNLENGAETAPQSWLEVSSMVENLKPGLDKISSAKQPIASVGNLVGQIRSQLAEKPHAINIEEIIGETDDDIVPVSSQMKVNTASSRKPKPFDQSIRIRTLEELDSTLRRSETLDPSALNSKKAVHFNGFQDRASFNATNVATTKFGRPCGVNVHKADAHASPTNAGFWGRQDKSTINLSKGERNSLDPGHEDTGLECNDNHGGGSEDVNSVSPSILAGQQAVKSEAETLKPEKRASKAEVKASQQGRPSNGNHLRPVLTEVVAQKIKPTHLEKFEVICPPEGAKSVVLYATSLRGIRKTYESCNSVRVILQSFGVLIDERDVSLHLEFRNELRELMGKVVTVPRLFIKGKYIGGAEEVSKLHEEGKLGELLEDFTMGQSTGGICDGCGGSRFLPCFDCSGSCKLVDAGNSVSRCPQCNENGLIQCPLCS